MARPHFALTSVFLASSVSLSAFGFSLPARAQSEDVAQKCQQPIKSVEASFAACTAAIDTGALSGKALAGAYIKRGFLRTRQRDLVGAEADLDAAIKANPDAADAYTDRKSVV